MWPWDWQGWKADVDCQYGCYQAELGRNEMFLLRNVLQWSRDWLFQVGMATRSPMEQGGRLDAVARRTERE